MRRFSLLAALVGVSLVLIAPAAEAQTQPFEARSGEGEAQRPVLRDRHLLRHRHGRGLWGGDHHGQPEKHRPGAGGKCFRSITALATVTLSDGSGTLTIDAAGVLCNPSTPIAPPPHSPGILKSFGNPFTVSITYEVIGGTGVFRGSAVRARRRSTAPGR